LAARPTFIACAATSSVATKHLSTSFNKHGALSKASSDGGDFVYLVEPRSMTPSEICHNRRERDFGCWEAYICLHAA
jgi:hypothetical protein